MAVSVSFTADVQSGDPPYDVQFADTSTGGPDRWLWEFGDGTVSFEQHPLHTYNGELGDIYDVKLTAWIFNAKTEQFGSSLKRQKELFATGATWDVFYGNSWGAGSGDTNEVYLFKRDFGSDLIRYLAKRIQRTFNPAVTSPPSVYMVEVIYGDFGGILDGFGGGVEVIHDGTSVSYGSSSDVAELGVSKPIANITGGPSGQYNIEMKDLEPVAPVGGGQFGFHLNFSIQKYTVASADDIDEHTEVGFIAIGNPPVASFYASPRTGRNPLFTGFVNTSTLAVGAATSFIWKKRVSGSGDAFSTFSTLDNPVHLFDRNNP